MANIRKPCFSDVSDGERAVVAGGASCAIMKTHRRLHDPCLLVRAILRRVAR